jgi:hypothetical protein
VRLLFGGSTHRSAVALRICPLLVPLLLALVKRAANINWDICTVQSHHDKLPASIPSSHVNCTSMLPQSILRL